jgi:predicted amidophosphoribosyltransferase
MRPRLERVTDALADELVPVPGDADDVCPMCRSWRPRGQERCDNCDDALEDLSAACELVIPISLYSKPSPMRERLTNYKAGDHPDRRRYAREVAAILDRFFAEHGPALEALTDGWDAACVVPSESRPTPHPLEVALDELPAAHVPPREVLLERDVGEVGHRVLSDHAYRVRKKVAGKAVLVLDDVYTTGGRAQSAASALSLAGARVAGIVVIARRVNPDWKPGVRVLWDRQVAEPFSFTDLPWWAGR